MAVRPTRAEQSAVAREQFEQFARRVSPSLLRTACLLSGDRGHAEDLLQATLWRTARHWEEIRHAPDAYAHKVLVNLSRDRRRELGRRPSEVRASDVQPEVDLDRTECLLERDTTVSIESSHSKHRSLLPGATGIRASGYARTPGPWTLSCCVPKR